MDTALTPERWQSVIGLAAVPAILPLLVEHVKRAMPAMPASRDDGEAGRRSRSPWPLLTDLLAVAWTFALWDAGLLGEGIRAPSVVLLGLAAGAAAGLGYDGWRRLRSPEGEAAPHEAPHQGR